MPLSLDEVLKAPTDPALLNRHLQTMGLVPAPVLPVSAGTPPTIKPLEPLAPKPMTRPVRTSESVHVSDTPLGGLEATSSVPLPSLAPQPEIALKQPLNPAGLDARQPESPTAAGIPGGIQPMTPPTVKPGSLLNAPRESLESFRSREQDPANISRIAPVGLGPQTLEPGTSAYTANELSRIADEKQHPMGSPENHPGFGGKVLHTLGRIGNIAGDVLAPGTMMLIPGTDLNKRVEEARLERQMEAQRRGETEAEREQTDKARQQVEAEREKSEAPLRAAEARERTASAAEKEQTTGREAQPTIVQDASGDVVGWKSADGATHSLDDPNTPEAFTKIAKISKGKKPEEVKNLLAEEVQRAIHEGRDILTDPTIQALSQLVRTAKPQTAEEDTIRATDLRAKLARKEKLSDADAAWLKGHTEEKSIGPFATAAAQVPQKTTERSDKSYQWADKALEKESTPIEQLAARVGRLNDSIAQNTPQADALLGPELLTVMAGGPGSGLRMNEAEIYRITNGRSNWESLKASLNKWSLDPSTANSITKDQWNQIRALVKTVNDKLTAKSKIIDDARQELLASDDPKEHRRIVTDMRKALNGIDSGNVQFHNGHIYEKGADGQWHKQGKAKE